MFRAVTLTKADDGLLDCFVCLLRNGVIFDKIAVRYEAVFLSKN
jgi:hypothetical protein